MHVVAASAALIAVLAAAPGRGPVAAAIETAVPEPMTKGDRQRLLAHLAMTESWLVGEVEGLTPAQAAFKASPESWSVSEVVEHLAIAEPQYWKQVLDSMKEPATTEKLPATDAAILWYGIDRTDRAKTGEARVPSGKNPPLAESLASFRKLRSTIRDYATTTDEDLRSRKLIGGNMQVYQWVLMISTHAQRHILQIREIKADAKYPRKS